MDLRMFRSVLAALLVAIGVVVFLLLARDGVRTMLLRQALSQMNAAENASLQKAQAQARAYDQAQARQRALQELEAARQSARYELAPDQHCYGGAVVQMDGNVYTQVGTISQPVHCVGRRADRPLR